MSLTQNRLVATSYRFASTASIAELVEAASSLKPDVSTHSPGWGTALDSNAPLMLFGTEPQLENIEILEEGSAGEALVLRLYWWEYSDQQRLALGLAEHAHEAHRLRSVDVVIVPSRQLGRLSVFAITRTEDLLATRVLPAIGELIRTVDEEAVELADESDIRVPDPDFYLWLIDLGRRSAPFAGHYELDQIRVVESKDSSLRGTALSEGVDTSRFEMLTLVALVEATFGPAKVKVLDTTNRANYDFELTASGQLAVQMGETHLPDFVTRAEAGVRAFLDVALTIVPALLDAYAHDPEWHRSGREDFIRFCRQQLNGPSITVRVKCSDRDASTAFYGELLGFAESKDDDALRTKGSLQIRLEADAPSFAGLQITSIDAGAIRDRLVAVQIPVEDLEPYGRGIRFQVRDPDGNVLAFSSE